MSKTVLFVCTGNFYRSRFSEIYFNHRAAEEGLDWRADSRGLMAAAAFGMGPIARYAVRGLKKLGIVDVDRDRYPCQLAESDLELADRVIAMKEVEHRPMMEDLFPEWADRIDYWHVDDIDFVSPKKALAELKGLVDRLVEGLKTGR